MKNKIYYYENEQSSVLNYNITKIPIDENYNYKTTNKIHLFLSYISYWLLAKPFAFVYYKLFKRINFKNTAILKPYKKSGFFVYANHTQHFSDCFCPALICLSQKPHIVVNADNVSLPFWGKLLKMWGALPLPDNIQATRNFYSAIENVLKEKNPIIIYPEANLWPYYTKIRSFNSSSFHYPIKYNKPVFTFTTVYKKRKISKHPKIEIYVDGPFFKDDNLSNKENQEYLRNIVFNSLSNRAKLSNFEYINYIKRSKND